MRGVSLYWILISGDVLGGGRGGKVVRVAVPYCILSDFRLRLIMVGVRGVRFTMLDFDIHRGTRRFQVEFG